MTLREAKQILRDFIRAEWSDEKLAQVYAFNADGKMSLDCPCSCIVGVHSSLQLHYGCMKGHYSAFIDRHPQARVIETAYARLGCAGDIQIAQQALIGIDFRQLQCNRIFSAILRAEMRRRDRIRAGERFFASTLDDYRQQIATALAVPPEVLR